MKYTQSIKKNSDFQRIYKQGKSYANKYLIMYVLENKNNGNRIGISVSKKVGNSVIRHKITRLIREIYRLSEERYMCGIDIVIIARVMAKGKSYLEIESALKHLAKLHCIFKLESDN